MKPGNHHETWKVPIPTKHLALKDEREVFHIENLSAHQGELKGFLFLSYNRKVH